MSVEYSHHYNRDYSYKSSRKPDYNFNKYQKDYAPRRTCYEDERDYNDSYDNYDNNRYGYRGYKPRKYQKDTRTCNHGFHMWKTEFLVKNTNQPEAENKKQEVVSKEKEVNGSECESLSGKSTNYVTEDSRKSLDTLPDVHVEEMKGTTIDEILEEREGDNVLKNEKEKVREVNQENDNRVVSQETDESDEEKFSNIDLKVEKKLLDNEFDDIFNDNHEEEERPIWEDVDTKQILEDIKKGSDFLSLCPQDILILNVTENEHKTQETAEEEDQDEEEESEVEDLNTIFALRVLERGFSRPSLDIKNNTGACNNTENYQESAKTDNGLLPIILKSPSSIFNGGCQSAFLPSQYGNQTPVNKPIFKKFAQDYDAIQWYYTGNDRSMQGPFSSRQMDEWYIMGYLPLDLEINLKESKGFRRLRELVDIVNHEGDFLLNNMNEIINWFNHYEIKNIEEQGEEEFYPPGIPISPTKLAVNNAQRKKIIEPQTAGLLPGKAVPHRECVSASLMGPKRLAAFNVYNQKELENGSQRVESYCKLPRNDSPLNSGISDHSFHNSPVNNNCFNPSVLPFPTNDTAVKSSPLNLNQFKSPGSRNGQQQSQEDFTYAWKSFINYKN